MIELNLKGVHMRNAITVLRSSRGTTGGFIRVYRGHALVWSKKWVTIPEMIEIEARVRALVSRPLRLIKGAA